MTMNSPQSLLTLHSVASSTSNSSLTPTQTAELMREVGLKCISFNGIPAQSTCSAPSATASPLPSNRPSAPVHPRTLPSNASDIVRRGRDLWDSIYRPFEDKLVSKLALSHPNLPVHILSAHYGTLLSDPPDNTKLPLPVPVGRILTSLIAISCLRAQTGVGPQVLSHVFGLRKAFEDGARRARRRYKEGSGWRVRRAVGGCWRVWMRLWGRLEGGRGVRLRLGS